MFYLQPPRKEHFPLFFHLAYKRGQTRRYSRDDGQREGVGVLSESCCAGKTTPALPSTPQLHLLRDSWPSLILLQNKALQPSEGDTRRLRVAP